MPDYVPPIANLDVGVLFCPGLLNGLIPLRAFHSDLAACEERFGIEILRSDSHPLKGCKDNKQDILKAIQTGKGIKADRTHTDGEGSKPFDKFLAIGYSKGVPDILTTYVEE